MDLITYIMEQGGTGKLSCPVIAKTAKRAKCSAGTLYQIALGHKSPSWRLTDRIVSATGGVVSRHDLRPDIFGSTPKSRAA